MNSRHARTPFLAVTSLLLASSFSNAQGAALFGPTDVGVARKDGKVFAFRAKGPNSVEWVRCPDYSLVEDDRACEPLAAKTMPNAYYEASFWKWLGKTKSTAFDSDDLSAVKEAIRKYGIAIGGDVIDELNAKKAELGHVVDYYRDRFAGSDEARTAQEAYEKYAASIPSLAEKAEGLKADAPALAALAKAKAEFASAMAEVRASKWTIEPSATPSLGREFLKDLADRFDKGTDKDMKPEDATTVVGWLQKVGVRASADDRAILVTNWSQRYCLYDPARQAKLQCFQTNGSVFPGRPSDLVPADKTVTAIASANGGTDFILQLSDRSFRPVGINQATASLDANASALIQKMKGFEASIAYSGLAQYPGLVAIAEKDGKNTLYPWLTTSSASPVDIGGGRVSAFATPIAGSTDAKSFVCWIRDGVVECDHKGANAGSAFAARRAPESVQLTGVRRIATPYTGNSNNPVVCSGSDRKVACATSVGKSFSVDVDASLGMVAFNPDRSGRTEYVVVCAIGEEKISCFQGENGAPAPIGGLPGNPKEIVAATEFYGSAGGACFATKSQIVCTAGSRPPNVLMTLAP